VPLTCWTGTLSAQHRRSWARSGGRPEPAPGGGGEQRHVGVRQDPVIAERAAEQVGGHDRHALGVHALVVGAVDAQQRARAGAEQPTDGLGFQRIVSSVRSSR
jgi:hypothetical protein